MESSEIVWPIEESVFKIPIRINATNNRICLKINAMKVQKLANSIPYNIKCNPEVI